MTKRSIGVASVLAAAVVIPALTMSGVAQASADPRALAGGSASADAPRTRNGTEVVGGGIWSYGVDRTSVFSAYDNQKFVHSTAVKSSGKTTRSGKVAKGKIAWATRAKALFGNSSYWNIY